MILERIFRKTGAIIRGLPHPHEGGASILRVSGLSVRYDSRTVLEDISFELQTGDRVAVVGPNGAGKSTLFKVIAGVLPLTKGSVVIYGHEPGGHICIAYVPQRSLVDWDFPVTVADVVMMGRIGQMGPFNWPRSKDWDYVHSCLAVVDLVDLQNRQISQLSGGQQQRMFIARALAQEAELILMDEPLTGLDLHSQEDIFQILDALRERSVTVMVAMHDLDLAANQFDQVMLINRRLLGFGLPDEVFEPGLLMEAYGGHIRIVHTDSGVAVLSDTCCDEGVRLDEPSG